MKTLSTILLAATTAVSTPAAAAQQVSPEQDAATRTGVVLEMDCGRLNDLSDVNFCIKSSAWEMHGMALSAKDAIQNSELGLGKGMALGRQIEDTCNPRTRLRSLDAVPTDLTSFRDTTVQIMDDCSRTIRRVESEANDALEAAGAESVIEFNGARLGILTAHTEWLSGLDLSDFDKEQTGKQAETRPNAAIILRTPD